MHLLFIHHVLGSGLQAVMFCKMASRSEVVGPCC